MYLLVQDSDPVELFRIVMEELHAILQRITCRDLLEGIEDGVIGGEELVNGEVRRKHAAIDAEDLDGRLDIGTDGFRRPGEVMPSPEILQATFGASASFFMLWRQPSK